MYEPDKILSSQKEWSLESISPPDVAESGLVNGKQLCQAKRACHPNNYHKQGRTSWLQCFVLIQSRYSLFEDFKRKLGKDWKEAKDQSPLVANRGCDIIFITLTDHRCNNIHLHICTSVINSCHLFNLEFCINKVVFTKFPRRFLLCCCFAVFSYCDLMKFFVIKKWTI